MDFTPNPDHEAIADAVDRVCAQYDDTYWMEKDDKHEFPWEFYKSMADGGWLGIVIPEQYGGGGQGITEGAIVLNRIAASGAGMNGCTALHLTMFGLNPVVKFGNDQLKPERSESYELSAEAQLGTVALTATVFDNRMRDLIDYPAPTYTPVNVARAETSGLTLAANAALGTATRARLSLTLQDPRDSSTGHQLRRRVVEGGPLRRSLNSVCSSGPAKRPLPPTLANPRSVAGGGRLGTMRQMKPA